MNKKFRHEQKYLINIADMELLKLRLDVIMQRDSHVENGQYKIRSLYFDDYWDTAYNEKVMGIYKRQKYRIRIYNDKDDYIMLECKHKVDNYINKVSARLTREETDKILLGDYDFLLKKEGNELYHEFYNQLRYKVLRPKVIVDYEREPFVCKAGDVRITFDKDVRSTYMINDFFNPNSPTTHVLEEGKVVMEVKFTEFMPSVIKQALSCGASEYTALSKFVECYERSSFAFIQDRSGI